MALLDRVATLVRANLNDLLDQAENPETMLKQVILDMENQYIQVKTQAAIAMADLHLLEKKKKENADRHADWMRKAELAVDKRDDALARAALDRAMGCEQMAANFAQQIADQEAQVESLKSALKRLETKLGEARARTEFLIMQSRRSRAAHRAAGASQTPAAHARTFDRMRTKVMRDEALGLAEASMLDDADLEGRMMKLEREQKIDELLQEIKSKKGVNG
jgi:phage shock protein A